MKSVGQLALGLLTAAGSSLLVLAAFALALVEGGIQQLTTPMTSPTIGARVVILTPAGGVTLQPTQMPSHTETPEDSRCTHPDTWRPYTIEAGDTLETLAERVGVTTEQLYQANCMLTNSLVNGSILYIPAAASSDIASLTPEATSIPCGPPPGWVKYIVQPGDTLYSLKIRLGVSLEQLQNANCLTGIFILAGQTLYVPFIPQPPATATTAPSQTPTPIPSVTQAPPTETPAPTSTLPETPSPTPPPYEAPTMTETPNPTATKTAQPTGTPPIEPTATIVPTVSSTEIPHSYSKEPVPAQMPPKAHTKILAI